MKIYRVHAQTDAGNSAGFSYFASKRAAMAEKRALDKNNSYIAEDGSRIDETEVDEIEVVPTKAGILDALNRYADHPDNG